jgi:hypothetical protein
MPEADSSRHVVVNSTFPGGCTLSETAVEKAA